MGVLICTVEIVDVKKQLWCQLVNVVLNQDQLKVPFGTNGDTMDYYYIAYLVYNLLSESNSYNGPNWLFKLLFFLTGVSFGFISGIKIENIIKFLNNRS